MLLHSLRCQGVRTCRSSSTPRQPSVRRLPACVSYNSLRKLPATRLTCGHRIASHGKSVIAKGVSYEQAAVVPVYTNGELNQFPDSAAVYAVLDDKEKVQYIGVSRKISMSIAGHLQNQPDYTHAIKYSVVPEGTKEALTSEWQAWIEAAVAATNEVPPGNLPDNTIWKKRSKPPRPEVRLTAGKGITGITIEGLIDQVVKEVKVVAFIKGKRSAPQCGFSYKMISILNDAKVDFEVVDVLDEFHNPGLREAIKVYSQWPTIPQLYVKGEFIGGADIVTQLQESGELSKILAA